MQKKKKKTYKTEKVNVFLRGLTKSIRNSDWDFLLKKQVHVEFLLLSLSGVYYSSELLTKHGHFLSRRKFLYLNNLLVIFVLESWSRVSRQRSRKEDC